MTTFTTEDRIAVEPIPFAGMVTINFPERLLEQGSDEC